MLQRSSLLTLLIIAKTASLFGQVYINTEWVQSDGEPQNIPWTATALDGERNLIVVGNTEVAPGDHDVLVMKYDANGVLQWQRTYGGDAGENDYGIAVFAGEYGEIVVAATVVDTAGAENIALLLYNEEGTLVWDEKWNGPGELTDIPSDLSVAYGDHIYVCGATWASDGLTTDYFLLSYDWNGGYDWGVTYDYNGLIDAATQVKLIDNELVVTGGSAASINEWDYTTITYDASTGQELDVNRVSLPGVGLDNALALFMDEDGNSYITGYRETNGQKDIQIIKILNDFTLDWVEDFDLAGGDDIGNAIAADDSGNVYIAGTTSDGGGNSYLSVFKYDPSGQQLWYEKYQPTGPEHIGEATKLIVLEDGVVVCGYVSDGESLNYLLVKYSISGRELWKKEYDAGVGDDTGLALQADGEGIFYVSGITQTSNGPKYTTVKYNVYVKDNDILTDSLGNPLYRENEIIIKFRSHLLDTDVVDRTEWQHGTLDELLHDSVSTAMMAKLGLNNDMIERTKVFKFYRNYTRADSISISRLNEEVRMPDLWSTFLIQLKDADMQADCDSLETLSQYIAYAHPNIAFRPYSNDPIFVEELQPNITPTSSYSDAHINVEPAWAIQTGLSNIRIGVIDNGIYWEHPDFMYNGSTKIGNGRDYTDPDNIYDIDTANPFDEPYGEGGWHGTSCAGIIGALRNNEEGIAGIAGGDVDGEGNTGCTLLPLVVYHGDGQDATFDLSIAANAIVDGSSDIVGSENGLGCHVLNASWGQNPTLMTDFPVALVEALRIAFVNKCAFVNASGNYEFYGNAYLSWPGSFAGPDYNHLNLSDHAIIVVGGTGDDGHWLTPQNSPGSFYANPGYETDIVAPGASNLVLVPGYGPSGDNEIASCNQEYWMYGQYTCFRGTSAAAPHVTGVAALMYSQHQELNGAPNNLSPEDVEHLLEQNTFPVPGEFEDVNIPYISQGVPVEQDDYAKYYGHGRLNAGAVIEKVSDPYCVIHSGAPTSAPPPTAGSITTITVSEDNLWENVPPGTYSAQLATVVHVYYFEFAPNAEIVGYWDRESSTIGTYPDPNDVDGRTWADYVFDPVAANIMEVTATTYAWKIIELDQWFPADPTDLQTAFSLHIFNGDCWEPSAVAVEEIPVQPLLTSYPNPASDLLFVELANTDGSNVMLEISDALGRVIIQQSANKGKNVIQLNGLAVGTYQVTAHIEGQRSLYGRFIKL